MRFHLGPLPAVEEFTTDPAWRPIREPGPVAMQCLAVPIGIGLAALVFYGWWHAPLPAAVHHPRHHAPSPAAVRILELLLFFVLLIAVHELLHAVVHPKFGLSRATILGFWPRTCLFYAHYLGELTCNRFLLVLALPTLILTALPLALAAGGLLPPSPLRQWAFYTSLVNAMAAGGDFLGILLLFAQVPGAARVQNQGWRTYWRLARPTEA